MSEPTDNPRELKASAIATCEAPVLPYHPPAPRHAPPIGLIGCGGIATNHLDAYRSRNFPVAVLCDIDPARARDLRDQYFPAADIVTDPEAVFARADVQVVDLATHPDQRLAHIRRALERGKHVLSQKPFVTSLDDGKALVDLAARKNLKLAVNQNGRWAPYFSYLRHAVKQGLLGEITSCDIRIAWDHSWIKGTRFEQIHHIVLYDFAIHWFDIVRCVFGEARPESVFANVRRVPGQQVDPPLAASVVIAYPAGLATLSFQANCPFDPEESTVVTGTKGTFRSSGPVCGNDRVSLTTAAGRATIPLEGAWFNDGFAGAMGELLCAIEDDREPENSARNNLASLELCFAAVASADHAQPTIPGEIRSIRCDRI
jgi:predicted dehydrogenase